MEVMEVFFPRGYFTQLGNFSEDDFRIFTQTHGIKPDDKGYYPTFEIMSRLNLARKKGKWGTGDADTALKMARIKQITLQTSIKSKEFMPTRLAFERMRSMLLSVANKIRYTIKSTSPRLIMIQDAHTVETIMADGYNTAIESLMSDADEVKTWEQYGIDSFETGDKLVEGADESIGTGSGEEIETINEEQSA
jgi:hypothetical protein